MSKQTFFSTETVPPMFLGGQRDWSVDVLRCISCFMVCAIHSTDYIVTHCGFTGSELSECLFHIVYRTILGSPTVLFVMVSGIFFLSPERHVTTGRIWKKNILKMVFAYAFWCLLYALLRIHYMDPQPEMTTSFFIQEWMTQQTHLWYIPMIVSLYILAPIIRPITASGNIKMFKYLIGVFVGGMVLWSLYNWPNLECSETYIIPLIDKTPMESICQYTFWMVFGWIAYTYRPNRKFRCFIYCIALIAVCLGIWCNYINWDISQFTMYATTQKFSIFVFFKNTALFYLILTVFRNHNFSKYTKAVLRKVSDYTLIIYLFHMVPVLIMINNGLFLDQTVSLWVAVWIYAVIAYISGAIVAWLFHLFWDPIKKALEMVNKKS